MWSSNNSYLCPTIRVHALKGRIFCAWHSLGLPVHSCRRRENKLQGGRARAFTSGSTGTTFVYHNNNRQGNAVHLFAAMARHHLKQVQGSRDVIFIIEQRFRHTLSDGFQACEMNDGIETAPHKTMTKKMPLVRRTVTQAGLQCNRQPLPQNSPMLKKAAIAVVSCMLLLSSVIMLEEASKCSRQEVGSPCKRKNFFQGLPVANINLHDVTEKLQEQIWPG